MELLIPLGYAGLAVLWLVVFTAALIVGGLAVLGVGLAWEAGLWAWGKVRSRSLPGN